ncbi:hypothetical protein BOTBODRAFT_28177 [Botryobasidium botryosum FD-172 SS1]|uniref:Non-classical export protein 1 n=1 Tax=Botryobasidium botryosum (strain FD-172 SS1) TaxID=930990 RepID=A0A067MY25_BOTB1|nr:hypothetical protein BOTBODRAFT_28177 [Botryobasidium botryosum FD-172 SS1]
MYIISRTMDPVLGVFTGLLAYRLYETHPRTAPPPGDTLSELIRWRWAKWQAQRENLKDESWDEIKKELEAK